MFRRFNTKLVTDPLWQKVVMLSLVLFFIFLADAVLSSWVPGLVEGYFKSPVIMGFILSFSSIIGFGADLIFPQIFKSVNFKKLLLLSVISSLVFSLSLLLSTSFPIVLVFLLSMAIWGIYYEIVGFANHQFVAESVPVRMHTSTWAFIGVFKNLAYFIGPLLAGFLVIQNNRMPVYFALIFALISFLVLLVSKRNYDKKISVDIEKVSFICELEHWGILIKKIWPILIVGVVLGIIDAVFWTTGAVYTEELAKVSVWGRWFLPMYTLPSLFVGFIIAKKGMVSGKKKAALRFFLLSGVFLALMGVFNNLFWELLVVFCSSLALAITYPLVEGVYSDIIDRMGRQRKHLIGLCASTTSISYIVGPIVAGIVSSKVGSAMTFVYLGYSVIFISLLLMIATPKKLKLPQKEIKRWTD